MVWSTAGLAANLLQLCFHPEAPSPLLLLLPLRLQLQQLNGVQLTLGEKVEAVNMVGAAADGLVAIRRRFFPQGGLEDGGGAVLPTAAVSSTGSQAGLTCGNAHHHAWAGV